MIMMRRAINSPLSLVEAAGRGESAQLKIESQLQLQAAIAGVFRKAFAVDVAGHAVRQAEERRGDVADDWAGVVVVQQVAYRHRDDQVIAPIYRGRAARPPHPAPPPPPRPTRPSRPL